MLMISELKDEKLSINYKVHQSEARSVIFRKRHKKIIAMDTKITNNVNKYLNIFLLWRHSSSPNIWVIHRIKICHFRQNYKRICK